MNINLLFMLNWYDSRLSLNPYEQKGFYITIMEVNKWAKINS